MESIDYTINDEIVRVTTSDKIQEGEIFTALNIIQGCEHHPILVDIGRKIASNHIHVCLKCGFEPSKTIDYYNATKFKKLDTLVDISELTDILSERVTFNV